MAPDEEAAGDYEAWLQLVHPDDRDFVVHAIDRQNAGDPNYQIFEYRERHKDGHWVWIECRGACVEWDENGVPTRIVGTDTDITARKEAEETLSRLSRRLDLALEISRIGVFEADIENGTVEWDERLIAIYGLQGASRQIGSDAGKKSSIPTTASACSARRDVASKAAAISSRNTASFAATASNASSAPARPSSSTATATAS